MAVSIGDLVATITLDDKFSKQVSTIGGGLSDLGQKLAPLGLALGGVGIAGMKMATDLNKAMANVSSIMPGARDRVLELRDAVTHTAHVTGKSSIEIAQGLYQSISAYGDSADAAERLEISAKAAAGGLATTRDTIDLLSMVTKAYGDTSVEATSKVADLAQLTVQLGQTTYPELAGAMGAAVPIAAALKVKQEELFAVTATLAKVTGDIPEVMTQVKSTMSDMMKPSDEMAAALKSLGYEGIQAAIAQDGLVGTMRKLIGTTDGSVESVSKLFNNVRALPAVLALTNGQAGTFDEKLKAMANSAHSWDAAFKEQTEGINAAGFAWGQLHHAMEGAMRTIGQELLKAVSPDQIKAIGEEIAHLAKAFTHLPDPIKNTALAVGFLVAAAVPLTLGLGAFLASAGKVMSFLPAMAGAFTTMGNTIPILTARLWLLEAANKALLLKMGLWAGAAAAVGLAAYSLTDYFMQNTEAGQKFADVMGEVINRLKYGGVAWAEMKKGMGEGIPQATKDYAEWFGKIRAAQIEGGAFGVPSLSSDWTSLAATEPMKKAGPGITGKDIAQWIALKEEEEKVAAATQLVGRTINDLPTAEKILKYVEAQKKAEEETKKHAEALDKLAKETQTAAAANVAAVEGWTGRASAEEAAALAEKLALVGDASLIAKGQLSGVVEQIRAAQAAGQQLPAVAEDIVNRFNVMSAMDLAKPLKDVHPNLGQVLLDVGYISGTTKDLAGNTKEAAKWNQEAAISAIEWKGAMEGLTMFAGMLGGTLGEMFQAVGNVSKEFEAIGNMTQKAGQSIKEFEAEKAAATFQAVATGLGQIGGMLDKSTSPAVSKFGAALSGAAAGAKMGAAFGPIGAGIGAVGGAILGFINKGKQLKKEMEGMKTTFVDSFGGMDALKTKAEEAGVSLEKMFSAKKATDLKTAMDEIKSKLDTWDQAHEKLNAAIDKYGITLEELGPRFAQQKLDEQAVGVIEDWKLLAAAGVEVTTLVDKMGPSMVDFVNQAKAAGGTVPEAMRPMVDALVKAGLLTDANGQAFTSAEEAGVKFSQTMTEQFETLIEKIDKFVSALMGVSPVEIPINIVPGTNTSGYTIPGSGGGHGGSPPDTIPGLQHGGIVTQPTVAALGEAGPEAIIPLDQLGAMGGGGSDMTARQIGAMLTKQQWAITKALRDALIQARV